jgi:hypothetical protein
MLHRDAIAKVGSSALSVLSLQPTFVEDECKLFHSMRHFLDTYLTYIMVSLSNAKGSEAVCKGPSVVCVRHKQYRHYVR